VNTTFDPSASEGPGEGGDLVAYIRKKVQTVPAALRALTAMEKQVGSAKTYKEIKQVEDAAAALKILFKDVDEVKHECELVIIEARARIGQELESIPKATGKRERDRRGRMTKGSTRGTFGGRQATGIPMVSRHRPGASPICPARHVVGATPALQP
jgi:hypothetical protein